MKPPRVRPAAFLIALVLAAAVLAAYAPVADHDFLQFDDADYVTENGAVRAGLTWAGVRWALTNSYAGNWHPLTWVSHMADVEWFGMDAGAHHLTSVWLHALTAVLLLWLLLRLTGALAPSVFVAALFALHPLRVESVAWIAERKDVLSGLWTVVALAAYGWYAHRGGAWRYVSVLAASVLALMSKPTAVTLPALFVLIDLWPLGRWTRDAGARGLARLVIGKWPFWILAFAAAAMTVYSQRMAGAIQSLDAFPLARRLANVPVAYVHYLIDMFWPSGLAVLYPFPQTIPIWQSAGSLGMLAVISWAAVRAWRERPYLLVGWLWFLITLLPVIGFVQVGSQQYADRYTYLPSIGVLLAVAWAVWDAVSTRPAWGMRAAGATIALAFAMALATRNTVAHWQNSVTLWERAVAVTHDNFRAQTNLGFALAEAGERTRALAAYERAIAMNPDYANAHNYLGVLRADMGDHDQAASAYETAIGLRPTFAEAHNNLGLTRAAQYRRDAAIAAFEEAVRLAPDFAEARNNLAIAYVQAGRVGDAIGEFEASVRLQPVSAETRANLATALVSAGRTRDALPHFEEAARLGGDPERVRHAWALALLDAGDASGAVEQLKVVLQASPRNHAAVADLGRALAAAGRMPEAISAFQVAVQLTPGNPDYLHDLGAAFARAGMIREAIAAMEAALAADPNHAEALAALRALRGKGGE